MTMEQVLALSGSKEPLKLTYELGPFRISMVASASPRTRSESTRFFSPPSFPVPLLASLSLSAQRPELYHVLVGATQSSVFAQSLLGDSLPFADGFEPKKPRRSKAKEPARRRSRKKQAEFADSALPTALPTLSATPSLPVPSTFPLWGLCDAAIPRWSRPSPTRCR